MKWRPVALIVLLALTCSFACRSAIEPPSELLVFAAASTADAIQDVARDFEAETGNKVRFSFGASRDLARQIRAGAPAAVIVSADAETVDSLVDVSLVKKEDRRVFASNRLVVIGLKGDAPAMRAPADLARIAHLALGDPKIVPAGNYAKHWLEKEGLWTEVEPHVVPALDVRAALAIVETGHAEAGIVYRTDAARSQKVQVLYEVPADKGPTITYVAARLAKAEGGAAKFADYLIGSKARATFERHGFAFEK
ncbi:MAG: molybdate ABC transporter substrate-binding protein [Polyangiaceae bacterium]